MTTITRLLQKTQDKNIRLFLIGLPIVIVILWYVNYIGENGTILQGDSDWNVDQGYTTLMWAIALVGYCLFLLFYGIQMFFR